MKCQNAEGKNFIDIIGPTNSVSGLDGEIQSRLRSLRKQHVFESTAEENLNLIAPLGEPFDLSALTLLRGQLSMMPHAYQVWEQVVDTLNLAGVKAKKLQLSNLARETAIGVSDKILERPPLWFHMVDDAMHVGGGRRLGPMAGLIVAETLHAAVAASPDSILNADGRSDFTVLPALRGTSEFEYSLADVLAIVRREWPKTAIVTAICNKYSDT